MISEEAGQEPGGKLQDLLDVLNLEALDAGLLRSRRRHVSRKSQH